MIPGWFYVVLYVEYSVDPGRVDFCLEQYLYGDATSPKLWADWRNIIENTPIVLELHQQSNTVQSAYSSIIPT